MRGTTEIQKPERLTKLLAVRIEPSLFARLEKLAERDNRDVSDYVRLLVRRHCKQPRRPASDPPTAQAAGE